MQARSILSCSVRLSVRLSVCSSVTFVDHVKTNKHIFKFFTFGYSDTILVFPYQRGCRYSDGNPPNGGVECKGYDKMRIFSQISRCISETVIVRWAHTARQFISIEFSFHPYNNTTFSVITPGASPGKTKNVVKIAIFGLTH